MAAEQDAVGAEEEQAVEERAVGGAALVDADDEIDAGLASDLRQAIRSRPGHRHRLIVQAGIELARTVVPGPRTPDPVGVAGHESLGESDELSTIAGSLVHALAHTFERGGSVKKDGAVLNRCDLECLDVHGDRGNPRRDSKGASPSGLATAAA